MIYTISGTQIIWGVPDSEIRSKIESQLNGWQVSYMTLNYAVAYKEHFKPYGIIVEDYTDYKIKQLVPIKKAGIFKATFTKLQRGQIYWDLANAINTNNLDWRLHNMSIAMGNTMKAWVENTKGE